MRCGWKRKKQSFLTNPFGLNSTLFSEELKCAFHLLGIHFSAKYLCEDGRKEIIILILQMNGVSHTEIK